MKCSATIAAAFVFCAAAYGSSSAAVSRALVGFTPELIIVLRMLFGCISCALALVVRGLFQPGYIAFARSHFTQGLWPLVHVTVGGLLNLGIPHSLTAIAQLWIPSAAVQLAKPLAPAVSQLCSHFLLPDERFTRLKFWALVAAIAGVVLTAVPPFMHTPDGRAAALVVVGFVLLFVAGILFGLATVYFKWRVPGADITVSSLVQTGTSMVFDIVWSLIMDGPPKIIRCIKTAAPIDWLWPILLGVVCSGIAVHGFMYLVNNLGAVGANFVPFGQIIVGLVLGVVWLHEWKDYALWEVAVSIVGILFLTGAIIIGFLHEKKPEAVEEEEEEERLVEL
jgi:drug/metabolite transporter (DMT)-like permease